MPHSLSAKKRVRQTLRRRQQNQAMKSRLRTVRRAILKALETRDLPAARERLRRYEQLLHRTAARGPLPRNTAARLIGRMKNRLAALEKSAASAT